MSVIFPENPTAVNIHLLPSKAEMFTYKVNDYLVLTAWLPDNANTTGNTGTINVSPNDFYRRFCRACPNYHSDGCYAYEDGYDGNNCEAGYTYRNLDSDFSIANMAFQVKMNHVGDEPRLQYMSDSAFLQSAIYRNNTVYKSHRYRAANVHGSDSYPDQICWGRNSRPHNLRDAVDTYFSTPFNSDLLSITQFKSNCNHLRNNIKPELSNFTVDALLEICRQKNLSRYSRLNKGQLINFLKENGFGDGFNETAYQQDDTEKYLCSSADSLMLLDAERDRQAFFTMLAAGFTSLPEAPHVMLIPMRTGSFTKNGHEYYGHMTYPDALNRSWFIAPQSIDTGIIVGQI